MPVCRECFLYKTQEQERKQAALKREKKSMTSEVVFSGPEDEKAADDDNNGDGTNKLIVSVQKSQGSTSTQTNSGDKQARQEEEALNAAVDR